ncbi:MAG: hypothetical protein JKY65_01550 [Planctomycetes bacterium]|nr:hypothetical protein [Planctomycetota bacterium]
MLAMIEINLLPEEFRPREKTNLGLIGTVAVGLIVSGATLMISLDVKSDLSTKSNQLQQKEQDLKDKKVLVKEIKELEAEIAQKKNRQNTIIKISQSKVMWSLKLQQFSAIAQDFPEFWIEELVLTRKASRARKGSSGTVESVLRMDCGATGTSFRKVASFQDALKDEPNFFYHFADLKSNRVAVEDLEEGFNFREKLVFSVELPLRNLAPEKKTKKKKTKPAAKKPAAKTK